MSIYYPAGVTDEMIDYYFGDDGSCCKYCEHCYGGTCDLKSDELEELPEEEYAELTEAERKHYADVDDDDWCDQFEWKDEEPPCYYES